MIAVLARIVGPKFARPVFYGLIVSALLLLLIVARCATRDTTAQRQAEQTTRSGDAIADAAQNAVETITGRTVTESDIDRATAAAQRNIGHAQDASAVRAAVVAGVCRQASHRNDPACAVR